MRVLMIDNYDSFTWNIVQYLAELGAAVDVVRNDELSLDALIARVAAQPVDRVVFGPGPCDPPLAGITLEAIAHFAGKTPLLGVCLGHQAIGHAFGGKVIRAQQQMHGKTSVITTDQKGVFSDLPRQFTVNRYHSLAVEKATLPDCLEITATSEDGEIQGLRHKTLFVEGVQFHPESILSEHGHKMLQNFLDGKR